MSKKYLLEIGTEELPYRFIPSAMEQLKEGFAKFFLENNVEYGNIKVLATPRRLAVLIDGLSQKQPDEEKIIKGPIKHVAYDEKGNLTMAGKGFLNKNGVDEKSAYLQDDYLHAKVFINGKSTADLLSQNVAQMVLKLQGPYFMRWSNFDEKFSRPIRWVVSIFDNQVLPVEIVDVKASNVSRGHRFSNENVVITDIDKYEEILQKASVVVNQDKRKAMIVDLTKKEADKLGAVAFYDDDLLDEVTYLCEYPVPVVCDFDAKYLDIPQRVTVTVMASHQRYFALYKNDKLLNKFITIANYLGQDFSNIKAGNERVIVARLDDAIFFFKEDTKKPFETYVEALKGVTFQKGMGSVYDKTQRIVEISSQIAKKLDIPDLDIKRTALLCKADLTTSLVFEFTELQGFIGADYARISNENEKVVNGIKEHYFPLNADGELAKSIEGQVVGIADKLDTICAVFTDGKKPTGSSDPLGVRRAALGVIKTIIGKNLNINISEFINIAIALLPKQNDMAAAQVEEFFVQRLIIFLADTYRKDLLEACAKSKNPLIDLCDYMKRVEFIAGIIASADFEKVAQSAVRISKLLKNPVTTLPDKTLYQHNEEKILFESIQKIDSSTYETLYESLKLINIDVENFFEKVLVMDKDEQIKLNRLSMLTMLKAKYDLIVDFASLQI